MIVCRHIKSEPKCIRAGDRMQSDDSRLPHQQLARREEHGIVNGLRRDLGVEHLRHLLAGVVVRTGTKSVHQLFNRFVIRTTQLPVVTNCVSSFEVLSPGPICI